MRAGLASIWIAIFFLVTSCDRLGSIHLYKQSLARTPITFNEAKLHQLLAGQYQLAWPGLEGFFRGTVNITAKRDWLFRNELCIDLKDCDLVTAMAPDLSEMKFALRNSRVIERNGLRALILETKYRGYYVPYHLALIEDSLVLTKLRFKEQFLKEHHSYQVKLVPTNSHGRNRGVFVDNSQISDEDLLDALEPANASIKLHAAPSQRFRDLYDLMGKITEKHVSCRELFGSDQLVSENYQR